MNKGREFSDDILTLLHQGNQVADQEVSVRAVQIKDERLRDAIDRAYLKKYNTPGALNYAKDLGSPKSRATTIELLPLSDTKSRRDSA